MEKFRRRLTFANVVSVLALFVALGGGAYAATQLPPNSVGTRQLKDGGVRSADLGANSVSGAKVVDNSLTGSDIKESTLGKVPAASHADVATNANALHGLGPADLVHGSGSLLSNRQVSLPGDQRVLLTVPGLGEFDTVCSQNYANLFWDNTSGSSIDVWFGNPLTGTVIPGNGGDVMVAHSGSNSNWAVPGGGTISLGIGNDNTPRSVATFQAFAYQSADNAPCGFQIQGTLWASQ